MDDLEEFLFVLRPYVFAAGQVNDGSWVSKVERFRLIPSTWDF